MDFKDESDCNLVVEFYIMKEYIKKKKVFITHKDGIFLGGRMLYCVQGCSKLFYTEKHQMFLVTNLFKILSSWYIPLVKNKNTMFILAAFASNKLILMSLLLCKQNVECSAQFRNHTYCA